MCYDRKIINNRVGWCSFITRNFKFNKLLLLFLSYSNLTTIPIFCLLKTNKYFSSIFSYHYYFSFFSISLFFLLTLLRQKKNNNQKNNGAQHFIEKFCLNPCWKLLSKQHQHFWSIPQRGFFFPPLRPAHSFTCWRNAQLYSSYNTDWLQVS